MEKKSYLILAGGVGAAKFIDGLQNVVDQESLGIVVNTGDDIELFGLNICPDLDIITYTLAGIIDKEKGWGFKKETFNCLKILNHYYNFDWFNAGDKDLATHIFRTDLLKKGFLKSEVTKKICNKLDVKAQIFPMCDETVQTYIKTPNGSIHFEEYYIKHKCEPDILGVSIKGIENAKPLPEVIDLIKKVSKIIICPSNPVVSVGTILKIKPYRNLIHKFKEKVYAISPIIEGKTVKGPADKLLKMEGYEVTAYGVAKFYEDLLGTLIIDKRDSALKSKIQEMGIDCYCFDTMMSDLTKKKSLANFVINLE